MSEIKQFQVGDKIRALKNGAGGYLSLDKGRIGTVTIFDDYFWKAIFDAADGDFAFTRTETMDFEVVPATEANQTEHQHRYTVAVEWGEDNEVTTANGIKWSNYRTVTKLRCESCPSEINR